MPGLYNRLISQEVSVVKVLPLYTGVLLHRHAINGYFRSKRGMALVGCWLPLVFTICEVNRLTFT